MMYQIGVPELFMICVVSLILLAIVVGILLVMFFSSSRNRRNAPSFSSALVGETPLDILKARYARGEISKEQFEQMKQDLTG